MPFCPQCGAQNADGTKFCPHCGTAQPDLTTAPQAHPIAETAAPATIPAATAPATARKIVTALFSDLVGSTAMAEKLDPETVQTVMSRYFARMSAILEAHGGTVEKFIGDAIVAVFGVPVVHEDDALRGIRAALEMQEALAEMNGGFKSRWGFELHARIGVNTGEVMAGDASSGQGFSTGDTMNVAARLEQNAGPGEVLVGETTYRLTRHAAEFVELQSLSLKGKEEPVPAWRLGSVEGVAPSISRRLDSVLVGREADLDRLNAVFEDVLSSSTCELVTVLGSAGMGKSRLTAEFVRAVDARARVLETRCLPYGDGITFWALTEAVKQVAGVIDEDQPDTIRRKVMAVLPDEEESRLIESHLAEALGLKEGSASTQEIFWAARRFFEEAARAQPLVVVFDDIHWAAPTFLDLIEYMATWSNNSPIMILCPSRPELLDDRPDWCRGVTAATTLTLAPLTPDQTRSLIESLLASTDLPGETTERIVEASDGNPLFVEEMIRMLADDGLLEQQGGRWVATGDVSDLSVPFSVQALIAARLDRLDVPERTTLQRGSVVGKVFWWGAVAELSPPSDRTLLGAHLQKLIRRELLAPDTSTFVGEDAFRFGHILTRDAAYDGLPKGARADLHERFAHWLEARVRERGAGFEEILGYHFEKAAEYHLALGSPLSKAESLGVRAAHWLSIAGNRALVRSDIPSATSLLDRALRLLPESHPDRPEVELALCDALIEAGELTRADDLVSGVSKNAIASQDEHLQARAAILLLLLQSYRGECEGIPEQAQETMRILEEHDDQLGLAHAHQVNAELYWDQTDYSSAEKELEKALAHARAAQAPREEAKILGWLPFVLIWGPTHRREAIERCKAILEEGRDHLLVQAKCQSALSVLYGMSGRFDDARKTFSTSQAILEELGLKVTLATGTQLSGVIELLAGNPEAAEHEFRRGFDALGEIGDIGYQIASAGWLAKALVEQGRDEEAEAITRWSEKHAPDDDRAAKADRDIVLSRIKARQGDAVSAERLALEAVAIFEEAGELIVHADALLGLAEVLSIAGKPVDASAAANRALVLYERKGVDPSATRARAIIESLAPST